MSTPNDPFIDIRDKRMSELNDEQQDRAAELWLRKNCGWEDRRLHPTFDSIFRVIDRLRAAVEAVDATHTVPRSLAQRAVNHASLGTVGSLAEATRMLERAAMQKDTQ